MNLDVLLSDEFVEFSTKVKDVLERKKALQAKYKEDLNALVTEAKTLSEGFEKWKTAKEAPQQPKATAAPEPVAAIHGGRRS